MQAHRTRFHALVAGGIITGAFLTGVLLSGSLLAGGCRTNDAAKVPAVKEPASEPSVIGRWEWVESTGGIAGIRQTPVSTASTWILVIGEDGILRETRTGAPPAEKSYRIEERRVLADPQRTMPALIIAGDVDRLIELPDAETLVLVENVIDGFTHRFARVFGP